MRIKTKQGLDLVSSPLDNVKKGLDVIVAVRPEHIEVHPKDFVPKKENVATGIVEGIEYLGDLSRYNVKTQHQQINADQYSPSVEKSYKLGETVKLSFGKEHVQLVDKL